MDPIHLAFDLLLVPGVVLPPPERSHSEGELEVPRELAAAYAIASSRGPRVDLIELAFSDPERCTPLAREMLDHPSTADPGIAPCLTPLFACDLHLPTPIESDRIAVLDAWFSRHIAPASFEPGQRMHGSLLPAVHLSVGFVVRARPEATRDPDDLVELLQWRLRPPLVDALHGIAFALVGARAMLV